MRKIIQISSVTNATNSNILALCDDGSVWYFTFSNRKWQSLPEMPQDEVEKHNVR